MICRVVGVARLFEMEKPVRCSWRKVRKLRKLRETTDNNGESRDERRFARRCTSQREFVGGRNAAKLLEVVETRTAGPRSRGW